MQLKLGSVSLQRVPKKGSPALIPKNNLPSLRLDRDEVCLPNSSERFTLRPHISLRG